MILEQNIQTKSNFIKSSVAIALKAIRIFRAEILAHVQKVVSIPLRYIVKPGQRARDLSAERIRIFHTEIFPRIKDCAKVLFRWIRGVRRRIDISAEAARYVISNLLAILNQNVTN